MYLSIFNVYERRDLNCHCARMLMEELQPAIKRHDFVLGFYSKPKMAGNSCFQKPGWNATHLEGDQTWCRKRYRKFWGLFPRADFSESPYWVPLNTGSQWISKTFNRVPLIKMNTLQETNISHHWKSQLIFKSAFRWDMFIPRRVYRLFTLCYKVLQTPNLYPFEIAILRITPMQDRMHKTESFTPLNF